MKNPGFLVVLLPKKRYGETFEGGKSHGQEFLSFEIYLQYQEFLETTPSDGNETEQPCGVVFMTAHLLHWRARWTRISIEIRLPLVVRHRKINMDTQITRF